MAATSTGPSSAGWCRSSERMPTTLVRVGKRQVTMPLRIATARMRSLKALSGDAADAVAVGGAAGGVAGAGASSTQFGASPTCSNRMFGPVRVSFATSISRWSSEGSDSSAWMRSTLAMSGRLPPGRLDSVTSLTSIVGHSDLLMRRAPFRVRVRPVALRTASTIWGLKSLGSRTATAIPAAATGSRTTAAAALKPQPSLPMPSSRSRLVPVHGAERATTRFVSSAPLRVPSTVGPAGR